MHHDAEHRSWRRRRIQSLLWIVVVATIAGGLRFPLLGFVVPAVMLMAVVGGFLRGRYVCGWLCPRGAFYDRIMAAVSPRRPIPRWLRSPWLRWPVAALLLGFMVVQIGGDPGNLHHWGAVFVRICIITTAVGVVLALAIHPRTWCSFCPMGTIQAASGKRRSPLRMDEGCARCRTCEQACPMNLAIVDDIRDGKLASRDCLKCPECQAACPKRLLHF